MQQSLSSEKCLKKQLIKHDLNISDNDGDVTVTSTVALTMLVVV